ncbi:MAG: MFS transporter [Chloroflexota bacterium]|nr:MFS transporter [Chloroflexota bacterium]
MLEPETLYHQIQVSGDGAGAPATTRRKPLGRDFRLYATGRAVSVVGDRVATITLIFLIIHLSHSFAPAVALYYLSRILPSLLGGLAVGVMVDQLDRQRLMVGADLGRAVLLGAIPLLGATHFWALYPAIVVLYALTLVFGTAAVAALPDIVPEGQMMAANSILGAISSSADFAYAVGGVLVFVLGLQAPFYIDAVTFLFSAVTISAMRFPRRVRESFPGLHASLVRVREGAVFILDHPFLKWSTLALTLGPLAGGAIYVLMPLYANSVLGRQKYAISALRSGAFRFSMLEVALGVGLLLGTGIAPWAARHRPRGTIFGLGLAGTGIAYSLLSLATNFYLACAILILAGICNSVFIITGITVVQTLTPSEVRGRVGAARGTMIDAALAVGSALAGPLLVVLSIRVAWALLGAAIAASSLLIWLRPDVRGQV